jgi:hypothetical protein
MVLDLLRRGLLGYYFRWRKAEGFIFKHDYTPFAIIFILLSKKLFGSIKR